MFKPRLTWTLNPGVTLAVDYNPDFVWPAEPPAAPDAEVQAPEVAVKEIAPQAEIAAGAATATANTTVTVEANAEENTVSAPPAATEQCIAAEDATTEKTAQSALAAPAPEIKPTEAPVERQQSAPASADKEIIETAARVPQPDKAEPTGEELTESAPAQNAAFKIEQDEVSAVEDSLPEVAAEDVNEEKLSHEELVAKAKAALDYAQHAAERAIAKIDRNRTSSLEAEKLAQAVEKEFMQQGLVSSPPPSSAVPNNQVVVNSDFVTSVAEASKANEAVVTTTTTNEAYPAATAEPNYDSSVVAPDAMVMAAATATPAVMPAFAPQATSESDTYANTAAPASNEEQGLDETTKRIFAESMEQVLASGQRMEEELNKLNAQMQRDQEQYAALFNGGNSQQMMGNPALYAQGNNAFPNNDQFMQDPAMAGYNGYNNNAPQGNSWQQPQQAPYGQQAPQQGYAHYRDDPYRGQSAMNNNYAMPQGNNQGYMQSQGAANAWQGQNAGGQGPQGEYWGESVNNGDYGYSGAAMTPRSSFGQNYGGNPNYSNNNYGGNSNCGDNSGFERYKVSMATRSRPDADVFIDLSVNFTFLSKLVFYLLERGLRVAHYTPEWSYTQTDVILLAHSIEGFLSSKCFVMREDNKRDLWAFLQQEFRI